MQQFSTGMNHLHMLPAHYRTVLHITITGYFCSDPGAFFNFIHRFYSTSTISFNKFLNIYLRIFHSCFIKKCKNSNTVSKPWITKGIKTSLNRKRELYLKARDSNELERKLYYKHYCKILSTVIKEAKKLYYKNIITKSKNKMKTTWNIIHKEISNPTNENNIKSLKINNHIVQNQISIAN